LPLGLQARPFFNDEFEDGQRIVGWHGIAGIGDAGIPDGVSEIDVTERLRDAFMGDAHRLDPIFSRERERGLQHLARGPAGISNVHANFLRGHMFTLGPLSSAPYCLSLFPPNVSDEPWCSRFVGADGSIARLAQGLSCVR